MNFFIMVHSVSSYICLKNLIASDYKPGIVVSHKNYEREMLNKDFYLPLEKLCAKNKIKLIESDSPSELKGEIKNYELGICVGYMKILRKDFFEIPKHGIFNLHCGKLPEYRGRAPISRTIMKGDSDLIITLHKIDEGVDSGDIAIEEKIKITNSDDVNTLYNKFSENSHKVIIKLFRDINKGVLKLKRQRKTKRKAYTSLTEQECKVDWNKDSIEVYNHIRALKKPYPCSHFIYKNQKFLTNDVKLSKLKSVHKPGIIEKRTANMLLVSTKTNSVYIGDISFNGKKVNPKNFIIGERFN